MLGLLFLLLAFCLGLILMRPFESRLHYFAMYDGFQSRPVAALNPALLRWTGAFLSGTMTLTWAAYLFAFLSLATGKPMLYGNLYAMGAATLVLAVDGWRRGAYRREFWRFLTFRAIEDRFQHIWRHYKVDVGLLSLAAVIAVAVSFYTFRFWGTDLYQGPTVYSDFGVHVAIMRSFSHGLNFPTEYPHYPNGTIRYHFMFDFLAGNLEYLGLPIDAAMNLPSILSLMSFFITLYSLALVLTASRAVALVTLFLGFFRSGLAVIPYALTLAGLSLPEVMQRLWTIREYIGETNNENWGIWILINIFANQRHLPFGYALGMLAVIVMLPLVVPILRRWRQSPRIHGQTLPGHWRDRLGLLSAGRDAWLPQRLPMAIILGLLVGMASFWNGAAVICILLTLFGLMLVSRHRLEYAVIAILTLALLSAQMHFFMSSPRDLQNIPLPALHIGFLANSLAPADIARYYLKLLGLLPLVLIFLFFIVRPAFRVFVLIALLPTLLANTVQLAADVTINHKFIEWSLLLLNILVAGALVSLWHQRAWAIRGFAVILALMLTATGFVDNWSFVMQNRSALVTHTGEKVDAWLAANTEPRDLFLTDWSVMNPVLYSGRRIFLGWPYFAWSAGYDTDIRHQAVRNMYAAQDPKTLYALVSQYGIHYILVTPDNETSTEYHLNRPLIDRCFQRVFTDTENKIAIYKTY